MENEEVQSEDSIQTEEQPPLEVEVNEELTKAQELGRNQKIRAEKAEKELKALKNAPKEEKSESPYSLQDIRALNNVHDEDVERVEKFAKSEGVSIAEALKSEDLKAILKRREEIRKSAETTNTGGSKRSSNSQSAEQIVEAGMSGREIDPVKFAQAQHELRTKKKS